MWEGPEDGPTPSSAPFQDPGRGQGHLKLVWNFEFWIEVTQFETSQFPASLVAYEPLSLLLFLPPSR